MSGSTSTQARASLPDGALFTICRIESPDKGVRSYATAELPQAFADIAKARERGGYLLVGVVGSRDLGDDASYMRIAAAVQSLCEYHETTRIAIVSGGARGVDRLAERLAYRLKAPLIVFPANWHPQGQDGPMDKGAGYARNAHIAAVVDELVALPERDERGEPKGGTLDTITRCRLKEIPCTVL